MVGLWQSAWRKQRNWPLCRVSALSEPRGSIYFCDNRCSEKAVRYWQFASVVVEESEEAHTVYLCQQCYNEQLVQQGKPRLNSWQWRAVVESKAHRGRVWEYFILSRAEAKKILEGAARDTRSVATGISFQRGSGASQRKCGYGM